MGDLKEKIKAAQDLKVKKIDIPEWGVTVEVRTMKAIDRARIIKACMDDKGKVIGEKFQAGLVIASCFDPNTGEKVFMDDDYDFIMGRSAGVIEYIASTAMEISGLNREALVVAEKNS